MEAKEINVWRRAKVRSIIKIIIADVKDITKPIILDTKQTAGVFQKYSEYGIKRNSYKVSTLETGRNRMHGKPGMSWQNSIIVVNR